MDVYTFAPQQAASLPRMMRRVVLPTPVAVEDITVEFAPAGMKRPRVASVYAASQPSIHPVVECVRKYGSSLAAQMIHNGDSVSLGQFLTTYKLDIHQKFRGVTHISRAISVGNLDVINLIDGEYKQEEAKYYFAKAKIAIAHGHIQILEHYHNLYHKDVDQRVEGYLLLVAIEHGNAKIIEWMHEHGYMLPQ